MKKTKRMLAIILSALLLAAVIPMNAFAADIVKTVDLTVNIEPGTPMYENYSDYITVNSGGVELAEQLETPVDVSEVIDEEFYWPVTDYFELGCKYELMILFTAKEGYALAERADDMDAVTVNGEEVYFEVDDEHFTDYDGNSVKVLAVYVSVEMENTVSEVELTVNPVADYLIEDYYRYVSVDSIGAVFEETLDSGVIVTDSLGGDPYYYFVAQEEYILEICISPAWGCEFAKDDEGNILLDKVTVNGEAVEYTSHIEDDRGYIEYITVKVNIVPEEKNVIDVIEITIAEDLKGYDVEDYEEYITIETDGVIFDKYDPYAVCAYDSYYEEVYTFEGGDYYYIDFNFIAEEGYFFSPDGVGIIINGEEYARVYYSDYYADDVKVEYIWLEYTTDFVGNTFDAIIAWFRSVFELINSYLFGWIYY